MHVWIYICMYIYSLRGLRTVLMKRAELPQCGYLNIDELKSKVASNRMTPLRSDYFNTVYV